MSSKVQFGRQRIKLNLVAMGSVTYAELHTRNRASLCAETAHADAIR
jgi:hypothetical protein